MQLRGRRVLITGASGFIGAHLSRRLCTAGIEVHAAARRKPAKGTDVEHWWLGDLADLETVRRCLTAVKPQVIFHLAGHVAGARDLSLVGPTFSGNLLSAVNLLTIATEIGCERVVLAGSLEEPEPGSVDVVPSSPYAASKWAGNAYARMFHALYRLPVVILRIFMVYGPAQQDGQKLIPYVIRSLLRGEAPRLSSGERGVDWIYVDDVVEGMLAAACAPGIDGQTVDLGSGNLVTIRAVVASLVQMIAPEVVPLFGALPDRPMEQIRIADTNRTHTLIGWRSTTTLSEGLRRTVEWYGQGFGRGAV